MTSRWEPVHPQLMNPIEDPEEFIASSIYWYPLICPTRTEVLEHTLLCNGNGYGWNKHGQIRSVFAHIEPDYDRLDRYEGNALRADALGRHEEAAYQREERARLAIIQADHRRLARTYGPVRLSEQVPGGWGRQARTITSRDLAWTLLGTAPEHVHPAWQPVLEETRALFAPLFAEQGRLF